jgi:hypothetical protein
MFRFKMANFRKNINCPTSQVLLGFQKGEISVRERERIVIHLRFCEFCTSEVDFYEHYPQSEEMIENSDIPRPLFELAEALLSDRHEEFLDRMIPESDKIKA